MAIPFTPSDRLVYLALAFATARLDPHEDPAQLAQLFTYLGLTLGVRHQHEALELLAEMEGHPDWPAELTTSTQEQAGRVALRPGRPMVGD